MQWNAQYNDAVNWTMVRRIFDTDTTDGDGQYTLKLYPGVYTLEAAHPQHVTFRQAAGVAPGNIGNVDILMQPRLIVTISPDPAEFYPDGTSTVAITARCVDEAGFPLPGVNLAFGKNGPRGGECSSVDGGGEVTPSSATTNESGEAHATYTVGSCDGTVELWVEPTATLHTSSIRTLAYGGLSARKKKSVKIHSMSVLNSMSAAEILEKLNWLKSWWSRIGFIKAVEYLDHYLKADLGPDNVLEESADWLLDGTDQSGVTARMLFHARVSAIINMYPTSLPQVVAALESQNPMEVSDTRETSKQEGALTVEYGNGLGPFPSDHLLSLGNITILLSTKVRVTKLTTRRYACWCIIKGKVFDPYDWDPHKADLSLPLGVCTYIVERKAMDRLRQPPPQGINAKIFTVKAYWEEDAGFYTIEKRDHGTYCME